MNESRYPLYVDVKADSDLASAFVGRSFKTSTEVIEGVFEYCRDLKLRVSFLSFERDCCNVALLYGLTQVDYSELKAYHADLMEVLQ